MPIGLVNSKLEPIISVAVWALRGERREIEALIDTGYSGYLTLPSDLIATLHLSALGTEQLTLADGSEITSDLCQATIVWDGQERTIEVDTLESEPLIGMALLEGHDLSIRVTAGGPVKIESFSPSE